MSSFKGQNLFGSGPHRFVVHGRSERRVMHSSPGADGASVTALGRSGRKIEQNGTLLADDLGLLQSQMVAIESAMDGVAGVLVDDREREHDEVLMISFEPGQIRRVGPRLSVEYRVEYVQAI